MLMRRVLLAATMLVVAIVAVIAWVAWNAGQIGWAHIIGLGASVLLLVLIWIWPGNWQPRQPPT
jgi:O-antigen/teichoic acid export membrane protein